jgi:DNA adenine methylase
MKYMGSKARHAKELLPIILKDHTPDMWWVEPFVGGGNMIDKVDPQVAPNRLGCDVHEYLIAMWQAVSVGWQAPDDITEEEYNNIRTNKDNHPKELVGYVGFALSYSGKWWGGWRRDNIGKRNYVDESYRGTLKQFPKMVGVNFQCTSVFDLDISHIKKATIYCDPPYAGTTKYKDGFDHEKFYDWCVDRHKEGHDVFISEYWMPEDRFECVWQKEVNNSLTKNTGIKKGVEKLFIVR